MTTRSALAKASVTAAVGATLLGGYSPARAQTVGPESHALSTQFSGVQTPGGGRVNVALRSSAAGPAATPPKATGGRGGPQVPYQVKTKGNPVLDSKGGKAGPSKPYTPPTKVTRPNLPPNGKVVSGGAGPAKPYVPPGSVIAPGSPIGTHLGSSPLPGGKVHGTIPGGNPLPH